MKVLLTGATGLLGSHVLTALREREHEVRALARTLPRAPDRPAAVEFVRGSLADPASLRAAADGMDAVIHCAASYRYDLSAEQLRADNVAGTEAMLIAAADAGVRRVVVTSSSVTCGSSAGPAERDESGRPGSEHQPDYFASKLAQEAIAQSIGRQRDLEVVVAAPTVVLGGPARRMVPSNAIVLRYLMDPTRSTYPGGANLVTAEAAAAGHVVLLEHGAAGQRYLLGGENVSWRTLHATVADLAGLPGPGVELGPTAAYLGAWGAKAWARVSGAEALVTPDEALTIGRYFWYSSAAAQGLGYRPSSARAAIAAALAWLLVDPHLPRWVREGLRPAPEVRAARPLVPRPLPQDVTAPGG